MYTILNYPLSADTGFVVKRSHIVAIMMVALTISIAIMGASFFQELANPTTLVTSQP